MKKFEKCDGNITIKTDLELQEKTIKCAERLNMSLDEFVSFAIKGMIRKTKKVKKSKYYKLEEVKFKDIKITGNFKSSEPKEYKQLGMLNYITKHGKPQNRIVINMENELIDGYTSYVVIKKYFKKQFEQIEVLRVKKCYYDLFEKYFKEGVDKLGYRMVVIKGIEISPEDEVIGRNFSDARAYAIDKMEQEGVRVFAK